MLMLTGSGVLLWAPLAYRRSRQDHQGPFLGTFLVLAVLVPMILFNLYSVHDYYWIAVTPAFALGVGLGVEWIALHWTRRWAKRAGVALAGAWIATIIGLSSSWTIIYGRPGDEQKAMQIADFIKEHSSPDDWVVLRGWGWNPAFFYYAHRRGLAVPADDTLQDTSDINLNEILRDPVFGPFITCDRAPHCTVDKP
jgi:hypothetical protein